jgi:hypothetical protein
VTHTLGTPQVPGVIGGNQLIGKFYDFQSKLAQPMATGLGQPNATNRSNTTAAEVSKTIDLSANFSFLANQLYRIRLVGRHATDNDRWLQEWQYLVLGNGASAPTILGQGALVYAKGIIAGAVADYGRVRAHFTTSGATVTMVTDPTVLGTGSGSGMSLGNFTSGTATLTFPIARATPRAISTHIAEDAGTIADVRQLAIRSGTLAAGTTCTVDCYDVENASPAKSSPNGVNNGDIELFILPPPTIALVINGALLECHVGHDASDEVQHDAEVYIDDPRDNPFFGS